MGGGAGCGAAAAIDGQRTAHAGGARLICWKVHLVLGFRQCVGMIRVDSMAPGDVASGNTMLGRAVYKPLVSCS